MEDSTTGSTRFARLIATIDDTDIEILSEHRVTIYDPRFGSGRPETDLEVIRKLLLGLSRAVAVANQWTPAS